MEGIPRRGGGGGGRSLLSGLCCFVLGREGTSADGGGREWGFALVNKRRRRPKYFGWEGGGMHSSISSSEYDSPIFAMQNAQTVTKNCLFLGEK